MTLRARTGRRTLLALGFLAGISGVAIPLSAALDAAEIPPGMIQSDFAMSALEIRSEMAAERDDIDFQILMLGDSMLMPGKEMERRDAIPAMLNRALGRDLRRERAKVYPFAFPGAGYTSFYFLSDELFGDRPDLVLFELNLVSLSGHWARRWARPDHAAWLGWSRIPEAMALPLHRLGLTLDRMLWTATCIELGCGDAWNFVQREQLRASELLDLVRAELVATTGLRASDDLRDRRIEARVQTRRDDPVPNRRTSAEYREIFEAPLEGVRGDSLALRMIAATVRRIRAAGAQAVVYTSPINVEGMKRRGVWNQAGVDQTLASIETTVLDAGGVFVDLHDLLPDSRFRDYAEHLTYRGPLHGQGLLVARLVPVVTENLRSVTGSRD